MKNKKLLIAGITAIVLGAVAFIIIKMKGKKAVIQTPQGAMEITKSTGSNVTAQEAGQGNVWTEGASDPMGAIAFNFEKGASIGKFVKTTQYRGVQVIVFTKDGNTYATSQKTNVLK